MNRYLLKLANKIKGKKKRALLTPCSAKGSEIKAFRTDTKPHSPAFLNTIFMPPSGFPHVPIEALPAGKEKKYKIKLMSYGGARVDVFIDVKNKSKFSVEVFGSMINVESNGRKIALTFQNELIETQVHKGCFSISVVKYPSKGYAQAWATGLSDFIRIPLQEAEVKLAVVSGLIGFIQFQAWGDRFSLFDEADPNNLLKEMPSSPFWVREWEERSRRLWHYLLEARVNQDLNIISNTRLSKNVNVEDLLELIISSLSAWPYWRPSASTSPSGGMWERGNWANGFVLGSYGLCLGLRYDTSSKIASAEEVKAGLEKGWSWLSPPEDGIYKQEHFPSVAHWLRRSTNHGIVILASALVGARELNRSQEEQKIKVDIIEKNFWLLVESSFEGGVYREGIRYAQFSLQEALAYFLYEYINIRKRNISYIKEKNRTFEELALFFWLSGAPNRQSPYTTWGDCDVLPWKKSVVYFLNAFGSLIPSSSPLKELLIANGDKGKKLDRERLTSEPLEMPSKCLPITNETANTHNDTIYRFYDKFGLTLVASKACNSPKYDTRLCILGTQVHLTHNKDHDVGAFNFICKGQEVIKEARGRGLSYHSSLGLKNIALEFPDDVYSCFGSFNKDKLENRKQSPIFKSRILEGKVIYSSIYLNNNYITLNDVSQINNYHREFFFLPKKAAIIIVTRADNAQVSTVPYLNFILPEEVEVKINTREKNASTHIGGSKISIFGDEKRRGKFGLRKPAWCRGDYQLIYELPPGEKISSVAVVSPVEYCIKESKAERYVSDNKLYFLSIDDMELELHVPDDNSRVTSISQS
ncbi:hypothetical protein OCT51_12145 [Halomonas sp. LR3S48]|uniref:hypothetical protein n=1 Tax=Halomonas sp. LR3S48 TaxID=2982694 RepID=UPI0021E3D345|nr:hypothetical protein [Halomonas sp. LR3S48]UYG01956.1 hypothetical protein OCT51_12145 [Halomonas sp. LR3S48]